MTRSTIPPEVRAVVLLRDNFRCAAPLLDDDAGPCLDIWGGPIRHWSSFDPGPVYLQMSHTKDRHDLSMGMKAPSDVAHLISLCPGHHTGTKAGSNWEAVHREKIRLYLKENR